MGYLPKNYFDYLVEMRHKKSAVFIVINKGDRIHCSGYLYICDMYFFFVVVQFGASSAMCHLILNYCIE